MKNEIIINYDRKGNLKISPNLFKKNFYSKFFIPIMNSFKKKKIVAVKVPFLKYPLFMRSGTSDVLNAEEIFVNGDYEQKIPFDIRTIIDAGANIGFASIYYSKRFPKAKILALEPEKSNFKILKKNIKNYKKINAIKKALWNSKTQLNISNKGKTENWGFMVEESDKKKSEVSSLTVEDCMNILKTETIDLFKIDIEGSEKELFSGNTNWLKKVKFLVIELHEKMRAGATESFYKAIKKYDFKKIKLMGKYAKHMRVLLNKTYL